MTHDEVPKTTRFIQRLWDSCARCGHSYAWHFDSLTERHTEIAPCEVRGCNCLNFRRLAAHETPLEREG